MHVQSAPCYKNTFYQKNISQDNNVLKLNLISLNLPPGSSPYPGMSGPDVMTFIQKGCRMSKPMHTSDAM